MFEKESAKKWLVLLVILVALSLVVDLLSLNVLYDIAEEGGLKGILSSFYYYPRNEPTVYYTDYSEPPDYSSGETEELADYISYYRDEESSISYDESYGCRLSTTAINDDYPCQGGCMYDLTACLYKACLSKGGCEESCDLDFGCIYQCHFDHMLDESDCETASSECLAKC